MSGDLRRFARARQAAAQRAALQSAARRRAAKAAAQAAARKRALALLILRKTVPALVPIAKTAVRMHPVGRLIMTGWDLYPYLEPYLPPLPPVVVGGFNSPTFQPFSGSSQVPGGYDTDGWVRTCFVATSSSNGAFSGFTGCVDGTVILNDGVNRRNQISSTSAGGFTTWAYLTGTISANQDFLSPGAVRLNRIRENWRKVVPDGTVVPNPITAPGSSPPYWPRVYTMPPIPDPEAAPRWSPIRVPPYQVPPPLVDEPPGEAPRLRREPFWRRRNNRRNEFDKKGTISTVFVPLLRRVFHGLTEMTDFLDGIAMGLPGSSFQQRYGNPLGVGERDGVVVSGMNSAFFDYDLDPARVYSGTLYARYADLSTIGEKVDFLNKYFSLLDINRSILGLVFETGQDLALRRLLSAGGTRMVGGYPVLGYGYGL